MMRISNSCSRCRIAKKKCVHDGEAPCRGCQKARRSDCVLTAPIASSTPAAKTRRTTQRQVEAPSNALLPGRQGESGQEEHDMSLSTPSEGGRVQSDSNPVGSISPPLIIRACTVYQKKYPALNCIHLPSIITRALSKDKPLDGIFLACIFALCRSILSEDQLYPSEVYAAFARDALLHRIYDQPCVTTVHCLLMMAYYEWGCGRGFRAWMYTGSATRMIQSLMTSIDDRNHETVNSGPSWETYQEILNRTYWCCSLQDRMMSNSSKQPWIPPLSNLKIPLPIGDYEFSFCRTPEKRFTMTEVLENRFLTSHNTIDHYLSIIVIGLDIWAEVAAYTTQELRSGNSDQHPPWNSGSKWHALEEKLGQWRSHLRPELYFPDNSVQTHISFGNGEAFAYINLIYYLCLLFLHRQHIPFSPEINTEPSGPSEFAFVHRLADMPHDWWKKSALHLFDSARHITEILDNLEQSGASLFTPFTGFCALSAASMNHYVTVFPSMNLNRSQNASRLIKDNLSYLDRFRRVWAMGEKWWAIIQLLYEKARAHCMNDRAGNSDDLSSIAQYLNGYGNIGETATDITLLNGLQVSTNHSRVDKEMEHRICPQSFQPESEGIDIPQGQNCEQDRLFDFSSQFYQWEDLWHGWYDLDNLLTLEH